MGGFDNFKGHMINPREWLQTRRNLLDQVKSQVQVRLGPMPVALQRYAKSLDRDFEGRWRPSSEPKLEQALAKAKVVLSGDFHAYAQSQRAHIRVLRDHVGHRPVVLVLECMAEKYDAEVVRYLAGEVSEARFLSLVEWEKNWGFPWENYRPLFEIARDRNFKIQGLKSTTKASLRQQDMKLARRLEQIHRKNPDAMVFVVIGEWHIASSHLPKMLRGTFKEASDIVVLHQDVEQLYFKLAKRGQESSVEILANGRGGFCTMVSPPWMKWQSYLMYLEHAYDRDLQEDIAIDYTDHLVSLIELLEADLKISTRKAAVQVYCPNSKTSLARLKLAFPAKFQRALVYHLEHDLSFYIPQRGWFYLSRPTINHASSLAGQWVHAFLSQRQRLLWNLPNDFLGLVWVEAVGFFFSKWINPKRKAETLASVRLQLAGRHPKERGRKALLLALDHRLSEVLWVQTGRLRRAQFKPRDMTAYLDAARIVGSMLGERLFQKVRSRTISLNQLMSYLRVRVDSKDFAKFYWQMIRETEHDQAL